MYVIYNGPVLPCPDTPAVPESAAAAGLRVAEQRQPEHREEPEDRHRDGADRHRHNGGAGGATGAAGPHQGPGELGTTGDEGWSMQA